MGEFKDSPNSLVADVDCTTEGQPLCEKHGVGGYPNDLKDYQGGRSFSDLKKFASENLGPQCGPGENIGLCSDKVKAKIEKFMALSVDELQAKIDKAMEKVQVDVPLMNKAKAYVLKNE